MTSAREVRPTIIATVLLLLASLGMYIVLRAPVGLRRQSTMQEVMKSLASIKLLNADGRELLAHLDNGSLRSTDLVEAYLAQIEKHNGYLRAMLSIPLRDKLLEIATTLDNKRNEGKTRSSLHGLPIIIKVRFMGLSEYLN